MTEQSVRGASSSGTLATWSAITRATAPFGESWPAIRVQKSMTGLRDSSVRKGTPPRSALRAAWRSENSCVAMGPILPPNAEEPAGRARVRVPVIRDVAHVPVQPVLADLPLCHVLQMRQHVREMLVGRVQPVAAPDHHGRLADLALGDPADLVLVEPRGDSLRPAQHAVRRHSQYLLAIGSSSAGNSVMICAPAGVTITS